MTVGEIIYSRRKELGLTLEEIGNATGVSKSTVKKWENGFIANMRRDKIEKLAKVLQISPIALLGIDDDYAQTFEVLQTIVDPQNASYQVVEQMEYEKKLIASNKKSKALNSVPEIENILPLPKTKKANLIIEVDGDSMEPLYKNGDNVLVNTRAEAVVGDIGIFIVDGNGYIKKLGDNRLISVNPEYDDIFPTEYSDFRCVGKVLGKADIVE